MCELQLLLLSGQHHPLGAEIVGRQALRFKLGWPCSSECMSTPNPVLASSLDRGTVLVQERLEGVLAMGQGTDCGSPHPLCGAVLQIVWTKQVLSSCGPPYWFWLQKLAKVTCSINLLPLPCFRSVECTLSLVESRFLTALLLGPLVFKPAKGTCLPGFIPQDWGTQYVA